MLNLALITMYIQYIYEILLQKKKKEVQSKYTSEKKIE